MQTPFRKIDLLRLSGIDTIIGVDVAETCIRMVVLKRHGNPLNKFSSTYTVEISGSVSLADDTTEIEQKVKAFRHLLVSRNVTAHYAVCTVRSFGVRTITTTIPSNVSDIDEWIREHLDKLIKLPVSPKELTHQYEILETSDAGSLTEITVIRNADIQIHKELFEKVGLELVAIAGGVRDVVAAAVIAEPSVLSKEVQIAFVDGTEVSVFPTKMGRRLQMIPIRLSDADDSDSVFLESIEAKGLTADSIVLAGDLSSEYETRFKVLKPFGLASRYTLAAGLTLKGFLPEISPTNFLGQSEKEKFEVSTLRNFGKRLALRLGSVLLILLALHFVASYLVEAQITRLDDELFSSGSPYADIAELERQVQALERDIGSNNLRSSTYARTMYGLAKAVPEHVWLTKLCVNAEAANCAMTITGAARTHEDIADFLRRLRESKLCVNVKLVRSGTASQSTTVASNENSLVGFELSAKVLE